ncbi:MAG: hypothetical protein LCH56_06475 [Proteobacteria bacterium]|nr:hypothetical protein [Pseudomonadota bacterium]
MWDPITNKDPMGLACQSDLKENGSCIDAPNFDPMKDGNRTVQSTPEIDASAKANMGSLETTTNKERFGTFDQKDDGSVKFAEVGGTTTDKGSKLEGRMSVDMANTDAIGHSHPNTKDFSIVPGPMDNGAVEKGLPNYIGRDGQVVVVERVDGQYQVRVIQGNLSGADRSGIRNVLRDFQRMTRP